jgi:hypothetical protein
MRYALRFDNGFVTPSSPPPIIVTVYYAPRFQYITDISALPVLFSLSRVLPAALYIR